VFHRSCLFPELVSCRACKQVFVLRCFTPVLQVVLATCDEVLVSSEEYIQERGLWHFE
jgi:hypothetical protein